MVKNRSVRTLTLVVGAMLVAVGPMAFAAENGTVIVNGNTIELDGPVVRIGAHYVLLPAESYLKGMGAQTSWNVNTKQLMALRGDVQMIMVIGQNFALVNGVHMPLTLAAQTLSGKPYVPLRPCAEAFGMEVAWDA